MNRVYGIFRYDKTGYRVGKRDIKAKKNWRGKGYLEHQPPNGASVSTLSMICFDEDFESVKLIRSTLYISQTTMLVEHFRDQKHPVLVPFSVAVTLRVFAVATFWTHPRARVAETRPTRQVILKIETV